MKIINERPHDYDPECVCDDCEETRGDTPTLASDMTLRDYFAGQALNGCFARTGSFTIPDDTDNCYKVADAMIEARKK